MKRIESLTFLRFVAALIVVIFHYGQGTTIAKFASPFITSGPHMVTLFFTLSGFVLMIVYYNRNNKVVKDYYLARIARIIPAYIVSLSIMIFLSRRIDRVTLIKSILLNITFLQSWFPPYPMSLNQPAWSLSIEFFFYLTFPLVLYVIKKSDISWKKLIIIAIIFYIFTQAFLSNLLNIDFYKGFPSASHDLIYYFPLSHYCSFLLGIAGGYIYIRHTEWFNKDGFLPFIVFVVTIYTNYWLLQYGGILVQIVRLPLNSPSFYALPFLLLILSFSYSRNFITKIMSVPLAILLGEASYSIYIFQLPVQLIYEYQISKYIFNNISVNPDVKFYVYLTILVFISIMSLYLIEKPGRRLIYKLAWKAGPFFAEK